MSKKLAIHGGEPIRTEPYPSWPVAGAREEELLLEVIRSRQWGGYNRFVGEFEKLFAEMHDCQHAVTCVNGDTAIEMALHAAGIGPGDEVIVPAHSFIATSSAVSRVGAIPVFVDIDRDTYNISPDRIHEAAGERTKAVIVVHFGGIMADMDRIQQLAAQKDLVVIEDAAHAHGAEWHGKRAGSIGLVGTFSFQNTKVMTAGEGGVITTNDNDIAARARSYANCGRRQGAGWFDHFILASNYRMTGFQAAVLTAQLEKLPEQVRLRRQNAGLLMKSVRTPGIRFQMAPAGANVQSFYIVTGAIAEKEFGVGRDEFVEAIKAEGIPCSPFYEKPLYKNPMYDNLAHRVEPCPVAEEACGHCFWLPLATLMGAEEDVLDIMRAIEKIHAAYKPIETSTGLPVN
ncbi:MAG: DegT/DnrJ/EryC1/StrS family aminotransferase [Bryobacterales bacterium]|nr:DegT/DnrJ/EryC1/StrS family aminotransferase [Bryobacterales bacterium]